MSAEDDDEKGEGETAQRARRERRVAEAARRAAEEAEARRRAAAPAAERPEELGGRDGPEPTRYGDWEKKGLISDF